MQICSIDGCTRPMWARGWCNNHYQKWRKYGEPLATNQYNSPEESFAARTEWQGDCLVWTGTKVRGDYGQIWVQGKNEYVHVYAWEQVNGEIPNGLEVDHKYHCSRACCNVDHLRLATRAQNNSNLSGIQSNNTSGYRNVYWDKISRRWRVKITKEGVSYYFGRFTDIEEAAKVAEQARKELFGEFAGRG